MANREPLLDNGNGMDFFAVPLLVIGEETAVGVLPPLPADCRRTGIFDTIGELLLLFVGDDDVDEVDEADDDVDGVQQATPDCGGEDRDSLRVGNLVATGFGSAATDDGAFVSVRFCGGPPLHSAVFIAVLSPSFFRRPLLLFSAILLPPDGRASTLSSTGRAVNLFFSANCTPL